MSLEENLIYPLILLLTGGGLTGGLIPWYTNRQKIKQQEIDKNRNDEAKSREDAKHDNEKDMERERHDNEKNMERERHDNEKNMERERQDHQFRIKLKQELMESFHNYRISGYSKIVNFSNEIFEYYAVTKIDYDVDEKGSAVMKIPKTKGKKPKEVFGKKWNSLQKEINHDGANHMSIFSLKIQWYADNTELEKEFRKIAVGTQHIAGLITNLINSQKDDEFNVNYNAYYKKWESHRECLNKFGRDLVRAEIKNLAV